MRKTIIAKKIVTIKTQNMKIVQDINMIKKMKIKINVSMELNINHT